MSRVARCIAAAIGVAMTALLCACGSSNVPATSPALFSQNAMNASSKIHHVVIIFQENRSFDDLFNGFPGANTVNYGYNSLGQKVTLRQISLTAPWDLDHTHAGFLNDYNGGHMNGFDKNVGRCFGLDRCPPAGVRAYGIVPRAESAPYFRMARAFTVADKMFQTNEGPSFPAHQYIVSGTSTIANGSSLRASENAFDPPTFNDGGCDSPPGALVPLIDAAGQEKLLAYPCFDRISLMHLLDEKSLSWTYYQAVSGSGIWNAPDAILNVRQSRQYAKDVVAPSQQVLKDVSAGKLANVVWVTPDGLWSDHARKDNGSGPSWVAAVVNAIGKSSYWNDTAIFVVWDDWGGWYDHVSPPQYNSYELGFRVPLVVISPYAKAHYVSHTQHEFGSILKFAEEVFGLPSMHTTDDRADDLADCFDFNQSPIKFQPIRAPFPAQYFLNHVGSNSSPDDDATDYSVLYSFGARGKRGDGRAPLGDLMALKGAAYGSTQQGGTTNAACPTGCGTLFDIGPTGGENVVYRFTGGNDGAGPTSGLLSKNGALFGTTWGGGGGTCYAGCGTVYSFDVATNQETPLYRFTGKSDGANPAAGLLAVGSALYGTTQYGGKQTRLCPQGCGTVFEVDSTTGAEKAVHAFTGGSDGAFPAAGLVEVNGTLYGTTEYGGTKTSFCATGCGTVFSIDSAGTERVLYRFGYSPNNVDGANPVARLLHAKGVLFGTTYGGGGNARGTIFALSFTGSEHVVHSFQCCGNGDDGEFPEGRLVSDNGGLYGTTHGGGLHNKGTVFSVTYAGQESVVYNFKGSPDGAEPETALTVMGSMLLGTTSGGGTDSEGTVFTVAP